jgi:hypothetical protein
MIQKIGAYNKAITKLQNFTTAKEVIHIWISQRFFFLIFFSLMNREKQVDLLSYCYPWLHMAAYGQLAMQLSKNRPMFRSPQNSKFFHSLSIILIFSRLHGVLNIGKKNI